MSVDRRKASSYLESLLRTHSREELLSAMAPKMGKTPPKVPGGAALSPESLDRRWELLTQASAGRPILCDPQTLELLDRYKRNIEYFIGTVKVPVGLAGPLRVNGLFAQGDYYVPLATTEAALVASYCRGCQLLTDAGGCTAILLNEGVSRAPGFAFATLREVGLFVLWATEHIDDFRREAESPTRHGKLRDL